MLNFAEKLPKRADLILARVGLCSGCGSQQLFLFGFLQPRGTPMREMLLRFADRRASSRRRIAAIGRRLTVQPRPQFLENALRDAAQDETSSALAVAVLIG